MTGRTPAFAAVGPQLVVTALAAAQPQDAVRQDAALEEGVELGPAGRAGPEARLLARHEQSPGLFVSGLGLDEARQLGPGAGFGVRDEAGRVLLHQAVQRGLLGAVALVVDRGAIRCSLGLPADGLHDGLPKWRARTVSSRGRRRNRPVGRLPVGACFGRPTFWWLPLDRRWFEAKPIWREVRGAHSYQRLKAPVGATRRSRMCP